MATRAPLSSVSASQLNSRPSLGGQRMSLAGKPAGRLSTFGTSQRNSSTGGRPSMAAQGRQSMAAQGRQSLAPGRRSTINAQGQAKASDDPRQIKDSGFKQAAIHRLIEFLVSHGYDHPVNVKQLSAPSTKDFQNILLFLYRHIDPSFSWGPKFEDDVPMLFKRLRYPFPLSKGNLSAVGAPHAWPTLLAALYWLVELLEYEERSSAEGVPEDLGGDNPERLFFDFLENSYQSFLRGEDDMNQEEELAAQFDAKNQAMEEDVEELSKANAEMRAELEQYQSSPLEMLQEKKMTLISDQDKFRKLVSSFERHIESVEKSIAELKTEAAKKEAEISSTQIEKEELSARVAAQPLSAADVQRMTMQKQQLVERQSQLAMARETAQNTMYQAEVTLSKRVAEIEREVHEYRAAATKLHLIPSTAKHAAGADLDIKIGGSGEEMLRVLLAADVKRAIRPAIERTRTTAAAKQLRLMEAKADLEERYRLAEETITEKEEELRRLESKVERQETELKRDKESRDEELRESAATSCTMEEQATRVREANHAKVGQAQRQLDAAQLEFREVTETMDAELSSLNDMLMVALDATARHKLHVQEKLQAVHDSCFAVASDLAA